MLAMVSSGFGLSALAKPENMQMLRETGAGLLPEWLWTALAYQFDHVAWTGCAFWDLIQPSFVFLVGVALPFSYAMRESSGQSAQARFRHVLWRSFVLIALGVSLSWYGANTTNFSLLNVLAQIGLGYPLLYLFRERSWRIQLVAVGVILVGYWGWFASYSIPPQQLADVKAALSDRDAKLLAANRTPPREPAAMVGFGSHWNKHVNAAADVDRRLLNVLSGAREPFRARTLWISDGGYQTLNFIPSLATMLLGLMAGSLLRSGMPDDEKVKWLLKAGMSCFVVSMAMDTSIWPFAVHGCDWHLVPIIKRVWSPGWVVFSSGWTFCVLAAFYWVIDIRKWDRWSQPLVIVGMNSMAMYLMSQLAQDWAGTSMKPHLATIDAMFGGYHLATPLGHAARVAGLWMICWWMYRRRIFVRV